MIAKVVSRNGKSWKGFKNIDDYIERFEACVATKKGNLNEDLSVPDQMEEVAKNGTGRVKNPAYHFVLSWQQDTVTNSQMWASTEKALSIIGCEEHQWIAARHNDSKFAHCHILVNRIHPKTYKAWSPQYDYIKLRALCQQLDPRWKLRGESTAPSSRAADYEVWTGQQSMQSWGRHIVLDALSTARKGKTNGWNRFHAILAERAGVTYEIQGGIAFIIDKSGSRIRKVKAGAISPALKKEKLEESFGTPWNAAPYGLIPKKDLGYGYQIERWNLPTNAMSDPSVEPLYKRFIQEQKKWKSIGKWKAKEERRVVNERIKRNADLAKEDEEEALIMLRSLGGVQGDTARTVLSMLAKYDRDRAESEAKKQIALIASRRPNELFRSWLKEKRAEGDFSAGVALLRLKNQPITGSGILSTLEKMPAELQGVIVDIDQVEIRKTLAQVLDAVHDAQKNDAVLYGRSNYSEDQNFYIQEAEKEIREKGGSPQLDSFLTALEEIAPNINNKRSKDYEDMFPLVLAIAGADYLHGRVINSIYHEKLDGFLPYRKVQKGKYQKLIRKGQSLPDYLLDETQKEVKYSLREILEGEKPTWERIYNKLEEYNLTYGLYNGINKETKEPYVGGGIYRYFDGDKVLMEYLYLPYELGLSKPTMEFKLGGIVPKNHEYASLTQKERYKQKIHEAEYSEEAKKEFTEAYERKEQERLNQQKEEKERLAKEKENFKNVNNGENDSEEDLIYEAMAEYDKIRDEFDNMPEDNQGMLAEDRDDASEEKQKAEAVVVEPILGTIGAVQIEKVQTPGGYAIEDENLSELHGKLYSKYSTYLNGYFNGNYDLQRSLYQEREGWISENAVAELTAVSKLPPSDEKISSITIAFATKLRAEALLEEAWTNEVEVLKQYSNGGPQSYAEWLREREEEEAKTLANLVEEQDRSNPLIYRPIQADANLVFGKNLEWEVIGKNVNFLYKGKKAFVDNGEKVSVTSLKDKEALKVALLLAYQRYGQNPTKNPRIPLGVEISGTPEYIHAVVSLAAEMNIPIANPELQDLYKKNRNEHLAHQRNNAINNREPKSEVLTSEILLIQKEAAMDPENTNDEKEKHLRRDMRKKHIDDAITRAIAREYTTDEKNPVRILGIEDVSQGELLNVTMINNKSYAVVKSAKYADKSGKKTVPEIVLAEISPQNTKNMIYKIGTEIIVEKPFVGHNHEIEYVERAGGNTRSR